MYISERVRAHTMRTRMRIEGKSPSALSSRLHVPWVGPLPQRQASVQQGLGREGLSNPLNAVLQLVPHTGSLAGNAIHAKVKRQTLGNTLFFPMV